MSKLQIGQVFRTRRPYRAYPERVDGHVNHFYATGTPGRSLALLDRGINRIAEVQAKGGDRWPAILIRSTPRKTGSHDTPWQDTFDIDNGHIHYYGDNKQPGLLADSPPGNKALINAFSQHSAFDRAVREASIPLLFYRTVAVNGKTKGYVEFNGFGVIRDIQLVTQYDRAKDRTFSNYAFNFAVLSLAAEGEQFDWLLNCIQN